ncbi:MAG: amidohydrolase [Myxococcota bacterium]
MSAPGCSGTREARARRASWWPWLGLLAALGCVSTPPLTEPATTIYVARQILTMDPEQPTAEAVAVADGRIVGVGDLSSLRNDLRQHSQVLVDMRFAEKTLLPGLIDNHIHPMMAAVLLPMEFVTPYDWDLPDRQVIGVRGQDAYRARLAELEASHPEGEPLFAWGYHPIFHGELARRDLNQISTTRPIIVWHRSFHEIYLNDAAMRWMELERRDWRRHPHVDWARGHFYETGLAAVVAKLNPTILSPEWISKGLRLVIAAAHQGGVTTIADMATGIFDLDRELEVMPAFLGRADVPFRTLLIPAAGPLTLVMGPAPAFDRVASLPQPASAKVEIADQVKFLADGAFYSQLMQMGDGYLDGHHGEWLMTPEQLLAGMRPFWHGEYQLHIHVNGDLGVKSALDALDTLQAEKPRDDHRTTLHHFGYSKDAQSRRIADAGVLVSANPFYVYALADPYSEVGLGPERASHMVRLGSLARAGVPISLHSDFTMAPLEPLRLAWVAANRTTADGVVHAPDERLSVDHALRAVTIDAAHAIQMEDEVGSIRVGKRADFTVLEEDPTAVPPERLADIPIWGTVFEGTPHPRAN